jgi:proline iminopeptidase
MTRSLILMTLALAGCLDPGEPGNLVPKTVSEDPTLPRIEVAGTVLHGEAFGDPGAPTVMVLHGGPGGDYRALLRLRALADDGYRVVFWDQRGTGLSQRHDASIYTFPLYLEDLRLVIEKMATPGQPFVFIGQSWGAMYATWFINEYGDYGGRLRGAVLSEPGAFTDEQLDAFMDSIEGSIDFTGEQLNDVLWSRQFMSATDHARADYLAAILSMTGPPNEHRDPAKRSPLWREGAVVGAALFKLAKTEGFDWTTRLRTFGHKVLFLRGDLNTAATLEHQQELASSYADAQIVTITGVGHDAVWERSEDYLARTRDYFQAIGFVGGAR